MRDDGVSNGAAGCRPNAQDVGVDGAAKLQPADPSSASDPCPF